jgi:hypothetical protein
VSFKFGCGQIHCLFICLFICLFCFVYLLVLFVFVYKFLFCFVTLLIGYDLYHNCGLCVIGVFNLFEHWISLEILDFYSCVGLERLHLCD